MHTCLLTGTVLLLERNVPVCLAKSVEQVSVSGCDKSSQAMCLHLQVFLQDVQQNQFRQHGRAQ